jgi:hypothetical protein
MVGCGSERVNFFSSSVRVAVHADAEMEQGKEGGKEGGREGRRGRNPPRRRGQRRL